MFQHLLVKAKVRNIELKRMTIGYIIDAITSVDMQEIVKVGGKVIQIYEGGFYHQETFKISPFREAKEKFYALTQKSKDEGNVLMQNLV